jgi:hypothetical protein
LQSTPALSRRVRIANLIRGILLWQEGVKDPVLINIPEQVARLEKLEQGPPPEETPLKETLIFEAETRFQGNESLGKELDELFVGLNEEILREKFAAKMLELKRAEEKGNIPLAETLLAECQVISKELHTITKPNK